MPEVSGAPKWLLLVHQLPPRPSNLRVQVWRRLQQVGAVVLRNSIYVLPNTSECHEDFEWLRSEITNRGGQASILAGDIVDGYTDKELIEQFRTARTGDYDRLLADIKLDHKRTDRRSRGQQQREIGRFRQRFHAIRAIDFFSAPRAGDAETALERLETRSTAPANRLRQAVPSRDLRRFRGRSWLTRPRPGIDRMASAWLIRRFIDPTASFVFGSSAEPAKHVPFDMPDVEFGHVGSDCTFETFVRRVGLNDPAVIRVGQLVHDLDLKEAHYNVPETAAIGRIVEGLRDSVSDDSELLDLGIHVIDALYRSYAGDQRTQETLPKRLVGRKTEPKTRRPVRRKRGR